MTNKGISQMESPLLLKLLTFWSRNVDKSVLIDRQFKHKEDCVPIGEENFNENDLSKRS